MFTREFYYPISLHVTNLIFLDYISALPTIYPRTKPSHTLSLLKSHDQRPDLTFRYVAGLIIPVTSACMICKGSVTLCRTVLSGNDFISNIMHTSQFRIRSSITVLFKSPISGSRFYNSFKYSIDVCPIRTCQSIA